MEASRPLFDSLEIKLHNFGENILHPTEESERQANAAIQKLEQVLKRKSKVKIDRIITAGSYGKSTALSQHFDIDLVAFINDIEPPFKRVLQDFEEVLDLDESLNVSNVHSTAHSIQFKLDGLEFDLLPAANYIKSNEFLDRNTAIKRQQVLALAKIESEYKRTGKYNSDFSSALSESQVQFLKNQTSFVHSLVRLCKFWFQTLDVHFNGKGLTVELIAVSAGKKVEGHVEDPMTRGFLEFLDQIIRFNSIRIDFKQDGRTREYFSSSGPLIMDPTNPWNNIADGIDTKVQGKWIEYAQETKRRILSSRYCPLLEQIFDPQPTAPIVVTARPAPLLSVDGAVSYTHPNMMVHTNTKFANFELEDLKRRIDRVVLTQIQAKLANGNSQTSSADVKEVVKKTLDKHILGETREWSTSHNKHEDYDVTFVLPFQTNGGKSSCWISFNKKEN